MKTYHISLVLSFPMNMAKQVKHFVDNHEFRSLLSWHYDDDGVYIVVNQAKTCHIDRWADEVLKIIKYDKYQDFYQSSQDNVLHVHLSANSPKDRCQMTFLGEHLLLFWRLGVVIDVDYGIDFDHEISRF